jgi:hypothetical protein
VGFLIFRREKHFAREEKEFFGTAKQKSNKKRGPGKKFRVVQ